jgi:transposase
MRREIKCSPEERSHLERLAGSRTEEARMVERAKIVLMLMEENCAAAVARKVGVHVETVGRWRDRYIAEGIDGLNDRTRSGKPRKYGSDFEAAVLKTLEETPPDGMARWDGGSIARRVGASDDAVWRVLRKHRICVARQRSWCVSTDPNFAAKAADIVGLYVAPPVKAVVICVDEKPTIQALERQTGYVRTGDKKVVRGLESTYKRHGTLNLFAALEVATGSVRGKTSQSKRRVDFLAFMDEVLADYETV